MLSSGVVPFDETDEDAVQQVRAALSAVCADLAELVVRNGEGCNHLIRVRVSGGRDRVEAKGVGKAVVNSPLFKCAVAGNDPNVGRLAAAVGDFIGNSSDAIPGPQTLADCNISMGGRLLCTGGKFLLDHEVEAELKQHMQAAEQVRQECTVRTQPKSYGVALMVIWARR
jgi:glutamate N-acetyltransferase/amino-acid N-acetyltransferase